MNKKINNLKTLPDEDLWCLLVRTWFAILRLRQVELARFGLTVEQSSILALLRHSRSTTAKELENATMRQQHSISTLINRMIKSGLVGRDKSPTEKRHRIFITEEGKNLFKKVTIDSIKAVFSPLPADEKRRFACNLRSLQLKARDLVGMSYKPPFLQARPASDSSGGTGQTGSGATTSDYELWSALDATGFAISRVRGLELAQFGLTLEQSLHLTIIQHLGGSTTTKEIENLTLRQHHSISTLINRMIEAGLGMEK